MATIAAELREREREHDELARTVSDQQSVLVRHEEQINGTGGLIKAMEKLGDKVDGLNKALYTFAFSFIIAAMSIAVTIALGH